MCGTILLSAYVCSYKLDHAEPEHEEPTEQAQSEDPANLALDQGKPWCIPPNIPWPFSKSVFMLQSDCALSLQELYGTAAELRFPSRLSLFALAIIVTSH
jgi:hypothetical protein